VDSGLTVVVAALDEAERIGETVASLRADFPDAEVIVVDGGSRDGTAGLAEEAGAIVVRIDRRGKGEALSAGEQAAAPGPLLLVDADLRGSLRPLADGEADIAIAAFARRSGGGFGIAKRVARELIRLRTGFVAREPLSTAVAAIGLADDLWSGEERGIAAHLWARRTTGVLKLVGIPLVGALATRSFSGGLLVGGCANLLNQLDTKPGRALKAYLAAALALDAPLGLAVLLLPYDLRERVMLGDAGSNALGAMVGLKSVGKLHGWGRWATVAFVAGLNVVGERRSLGLLVERTAILRELDAWGRR
jgi:hypothetical protein